MSEVRTAEPAAVKSIEEFESSNRDWVCAANSGHSKSTLNGWRKSLAANGDILTQMVRVPDQRNGRVATIDFFRRSSLKKKASVDHVATGMAKMSKRWEEAEEKTHHGVTYLRCGVFAARVGISVITARRKAKAKKLKAKWFKVHGNSIPYIAASEVDRFNREMEAFQNAPTGTVSLKAACRITGQSEPTMRNEEWQRRNNLLPVKKETAFKIGRSNSTALHFYLGELKDYVNRGPKITVPSDRMTCRSAAKVLGCTRKLVAQMCDEGLIEATLGQVPVQGGLFSIEGWLINRASVYAAREHLKILRKRMVRKGHVMHIIPRLREWAKKRKSEEAEQRKAEKAAAPVTSGVDPREIVKAAAAAAAEVLKASGNATKRHRGGQIVDGPNDAKVIHRVKNKPAGMTLPELARALVAEGIASSEMEVHRIYAKYRKREHDARNRSVTES